MCLASELRVSVPWLQRKYHDTFCGLLGQEGFTSLGQLRGVKQFDIRGVWRLSIEEQDLLALLLDEADRGTCLPRSLVVSLRVSGRRSRGWKFVERGRSGRGAQPFPCPAGWCKLVSWHVKGRLRC